MYRFNIVVLDLKRSEDVILADLAYSFENIVRIKDVTVWGFRLNYQ